MQAFLVLLRYDLSQMGKSWIVRLWVILLFIPAVFVLGVAANENELASESMAAYIAAVMAPLSWLAVSIYSASAVSGEAGIATDAILSKSVTRTEYISAKVVARVGMTGLVYACDHAAVHVSAAALRGPRCHHPGRHPRPRHGRRTADVPRGAGHPAIDRVPQRADRGALCADERAALGLALQFLELNWLSTTAVINELPHTFRGDTSTLTAIRVLIVFAALTVAAISSSLWLFRQKDL